MKEIKDEIKWETPRDTFQFIATVITILLLAGIFIVSIFLDDIIKLLPTIGG
jgi:hypothetical protein